MIPSDPQNWTIANLSKVDIYDGIILCAGLNNSSYHLLDEEFFKQLKENVTIINPARGSLISERALLSYLESNPNNKVYLDVFETEPANFSVFSKFPNVYLSSHIAGVYKGIDDAIISYEYNLIDSFINLSRDKFQEKYSALNLKNKIINGILI